MVGKNEDPAVVREKEVRVALLVAVLNMRDIGRRRQFCLR
jgi:hypothetical protein